MRSCRVLPSAGDITAHGRVLLQDMRLSAHDDADRHLQESVLRRLRLRLAE